MAIGNRGKPVAVMLLGVAYQPPFATLLSKLAGNGAGRKVPERSGGRPLVRRADVAGDNPKLPAAGTFPID